MKTSLEFSSFGGAGHCAGSPVCFLRNGPATANHRRQGRRAFTLVELLVVIAVILVLIGLAAPSVRGWRDAQVRSAAAENITALLNEARTSALAQGRTTYFIVSHYPGLTARITLADGLRSESPGWRYFAVYQQQADPTLPLHALTRWYRLPEGCELVTSDDYPSLLCAPEGDPLPLPLEADTERNETLRFLAFDASGSVQHPFSSQHARLWLRIPSDEAPGQISVALFTGRPTCKW